MDNNIAELEEQNERLKNWYNEKAGECAELKEQLKELPKQIVEKIKQALYDITIYSGNITCDDMNSIFEHILKEYQGDGE